MTARGEDMRDEKLIAVITGAIMAYIETEEESSPATPEAKTIAKS